MKGLLKIFFWYWFPAPKVGERYRDNDHLDDPWHTDYIDIVAREGEWYLVRSQGGYEYSKRRSSIVIFYTKIS